MVPTSAQMVMLQEVFFNNLKRTDLDCWIAYPSSIECNLEIVPLPLESDVSHHAHLSMASVVLRLGSGVCKPKRVKI